MDAIDTSSLKGNYILDASEGHAQVVDRQAGVEIEITPQMAFEGGCELEGFNPAFESVSHAAARVYRAMEICRRQSILDD